MKYFVTSDLHLGHTNIIKYCDRPFKSLQHMNETLIERWNSRVGDDDVIYHIGDFCFRNSYDGDKGTRITAKEWLERLNGRIILIKGNHDKNNTVKTTIKSLQIEYDDLKINLVHDPLEADLRYKLNLVGHVHQHWKVQRRKRHRVLINAGVDVWRYYPATLEEVMRLYHETIASRRRSSKNKRV